MELRPYQQEALEQMLDAGRIIYGDAAGSGKTLTTAHWIAADCDRALVVVPSDKIGQQWVSTLEELGLSTCHVQTGARKSKRTTAYEDVGADVLILPYTTLRIDQDAIVKWRLDTVVFDESHHLKGRTSQTHKAAAKVARRCDRLALLSGTPIMNDAEEAWSSQRLIDPKRWPSFWRWAREHFFLEERYFNGPGFNSTTLVGDIQPGHEEILREEFGEHLLKRPMSELMPDLPPVVEHTIEVELDGEERKHYDSMSKHSWMRGGDGTVIFAPNEVTKITRLRQLVSDLSQLGDEDTPGSKVLAVADLIASSDEQFVVLTSYVGAAVSLCNELNSKGWEHDYGYDAVAHIGSMSSKERQVSIDAFTTGDVQAIVGTHQTLGEGVDGLQCARNIVLLDRDWTPARNEQGIARVRRSGQEADVVNVYDVVALDTVDQAVAEANRRKQNIVDLIVGKDIEVVLAGKVS